MQTVYILGAGASVFAGFPLGRELLAFLKSEYRSTLDSMDKDIGGYALEFIERVRDKIPPTRVLSNGDPDLEFVLSLVEPTPQNVSLEGAEFDSLVDDLETIRRKISLQTGELAKVKRGFNKLVASAFQYRSYEFLRRSTARTDKGLVALLDAWTARIRPGDTIITLNWDLVQEIVLWREKKWSYDDGYGTRATPDMRSNGSRTMILKLHGSCNWALRHDRDPSLRIDYTDLFFDDEYTVGKEFVPLGSTSDFGESLIVPSYFKNPSQVSVLNPVWDEAKKVLTTTENLVVVGYSLANADLFAQRLFREAIRQNTKLSSIVLVLGTNDEGFQRWEELCRECQKACTKVRKKFEEFVTAQE